MKYLKLEWNAQCNIARKCSWSSSNYRKIKLKHRDGMVITLGYFHLSRKNRGKSTPALFSPKSIVACSYYSHQRDKSKFSRPWNHNQSYENSRLSVSRLRPSLLFCGGENEVDYTNFIQNVTSSRIGCDIHKIFLNVRQYIRGFNKKKYQYRPRAVLSQPVHRTVTYWEWRYQMLY